MSSRETTSVYELFKKQKEKIEELPPDDQQKKERVLPLYLLFLDELSVLEEGMKYYEQFKALTTRLKSNNIEFKEGKNFQDMNSLVFTIFKELRISIFRSQKPNKPLETFLDEELRTVAFSQSYSLREKLKDLGLTLSIYYPDESSDICKAIAAIDPGYNSDPYKIVDQIRREWKALSAASFFFFPFPSLPFFFFFFFFFLSRLDPLFTFSFFIYFFTFY